MDDTKTQERRQRVLQQKRKYANKCWIYDECGDNISFIIKVGISIQANMQTNAGLVKNATVV